MTRVFAAPDRERTRRSAARNGDRIGGAIVAEGFAVVEDFVDATLARALAAEARRRDAAGDFRAAGIGRGSRREQRSDIRGDRILWLEQETPTPPERALWKALETLRRALNRTALLGLLSLEAHYAIYPAGAFYRRHRDRFPDDDARVLSWVLYLNERWTAADGGALRIHVPDGRARDIVPVGGTLACFLADRFEHEVLPPARERLSIAGWFRRRERAP
jgi:SM-20-related protein